MRATAGLPDYRQLWEVAPFVLGLLGIAGVAICAWRALGSAAGLACAAVLLSTSEALRGILYVPESRVLLVLHMAALCGGLLYAQRRARTGRWRSLVVISLPLIAFTGAGATDQLVIVVALAPFMLAPALCWWRDRSRQWRAITAFAAATGVLSLLLAVLLTSVMHGEQVSSGGGRSSTYAMRQSVQVVAVVGVKTATLSLPSTMFLSEFPPRAVPQRD